MKPEIITPFVTIMVLSFIVARNRSGKEAKKMTEIAAEYISGIMEKLHRLSEGWA